VIPVFLTCLGRLSAGGKEEPCVVYKGLYFCHFEWNRHIISLSGPGFRPSVNTLQGRLKDC